MNHKQHQPQGQPAPHCTTQEVTSHKRASPDRICRPTLTPQRKTPALKPPSSTSLADAKKENLVRQLQPHQGGKGHSQGHWYQHHGLSILAASLVQQAGEEGALLQPPDLSPTTLPAAAIFSEISGHCNYNYQEQIRQVKYQLPREKLLCQPGGSKCQNPWL